MSTVREIAKELLLRTEAAGQYSNLALDTALSRHTLDERDRGLLTTLFYGVIEHRITLDYVIDSLSGIAPVQIEDEVRTALRLGLYQLIYLDRVPDHAAIFESVALCPRRARGFANALLRRFVREGKRVMLPDREGDPIFYLSVAHSVPRALAARFVAAFGEARTDALLGALDTPPPVTVRTNTQVITREALLRQLGEGATPTRYAPHGVRLADGAAVGALVEQGLCFVQDEASQIAVEALDARPHMRVLDLCAAPGSKSFGAALCMQNKGEVLSFDLHKNKVSLIKRGAERLGLSVITADAGDARHAPDKGLGLFDRVIADVPCSGFGVIAKKPDIRYKDVESAAGLLPVQAAILDAAAKCVAVGGRLLYSTCTLLPEENEEQLRAFLAAHGEFAPVPFAVGGLAADTGMLTLLPDIHGTDGFFMAVMERIKE